jgi:hypothetical protein
MPDTCDNTSRAVHSGVHGTGADQSSADSVTAKSWNDE